jgi:hypothetical protein
MGEAVHYTSIRSVAQLRSNIQPSNSFLGRTSWLPVGYGVPVLDRRRDNDGTPLRSA